METFAASNAAVRPVRDVAFGDLAVTIDSRRDGTIIVRPVNDLALYPSSMCELLEHWASAAPDRVFVAEREPCGGWRKLTYAQALDAARAAGAALAERKLSVERPLVILSGNDVDHAILALGAMYAGVPYCPVSPAYSLVSTDYGKLRHVFKLLTPGLVYVTDGAPFAKALKAVCPDNTELAVKINAPAGRDVTLLADLLATKPGPALDTARAAVGPDTIVKFLLTSGSTGLPKAVINTQRMLTSNQVMLREALAFLKDAPVILDWLPWNHTFGGNHNFGLVLFNGGSLYIDAGKPVPGGIETTVANLREVAPTVYFNVPKGYEFLLPYLRKDAALRETFFSQLQAMFFSGAGMSPHVWNELEDLAFQTIGARVPILTGLGATETSPFALCCTPDTTGSGRVGVPVPGNVLKLAQVNDKLEARVKGPNITPGYWRQPELTAAAFDDEGFYRFGDALRFVDPTDVTKGFWFDGRITEDFKLSSGTWVSVGPLRARFISHCAPLVRDVVFAAPNREYLAALVFIDADACRALAGDLPANTELNEIISHPTVREAMRKHLENLARMPGGSSQRVIRAVLLPTPPALDKGEVTDKGSINQRAVLTERAALVEAVYAGDASTNMIAVEEVTA